MLVTTAFLHREIARESLLKLVLLHPYTNLNKESHMAPVALTLSFTATAFIVVLASIGYMHLTSQIYDALLPYFNKLHAYVIKKGWL